MNTTAELNRAPQTLPGAQSLLAGDPVDRRTVLRAALRTAAGAGMALGVPAALAGCGQYVKIVAPQQLYSIDLLSDPYVDFPGIESLIADRVRTSGVAISLKTWSDATGQQQFFQSETSGPENIQPIDPATDKPVLGVKVFVVQALDPATLDPIAQASLKTGAQIVSFLTPLEHQTAQITVDPGQLGSLLATDAAAWARSTLHAPATALFVFPWPGFIDQGTFLASAANAQAEQQAARAAFTRLSPDLALSTLQAPARGPETADSVARAMRADPSVRIVLCALDTDAVAVAQMLRGRGAPDDGRADVYVGGFGAPTIAPPALAELRLDLALRAIAAVRPRDLAYALVDLPLALLDNKKPYNVVIPGELVTPRSPLLAAYQTDYAQPQTPPNTGPAGPPSSGNVVSINAASTNPSLPSSG
jgi:ABC-type sugar transport system substrate-binding protein